MYLLEFYEVKIVSILNLINNFVKGIYTWVEVLRDSPGINNLNIFFGKTFALRYFLL